MNETHCTNVVVRARLHQFRAGTGHLLRSGAVLLGMCLAMNLPAQQTTSTPPTDSSAQASPVNGTKAPVTANDSSAQASPIAAPAVAGGLRARTHLAVKLSDPISSATAHNDQTVHGTLATAIDAGKGKTLPAGTPVSMTLVAVAPAGQITSYGEMTLQVTRVGRYGTLSDTQTLRGDKGSKLLADSARDKGGEAVLRPGTILHFVVAQWNTPATAAPHDPQIGNANPVPGKQ